MLHRDVELAHGRQHGAHRQAALHLTHAQRARPRNLLRQHDREVALCDGDAARARGGSAWGVRAVWVAGTAVQPPGALALGATQVPESPCDLSLASASPHFIWPPHHAR